MESVGVVVGPGGLYRSATPPPKAEDEGAKSDGGDKKKGGEEGRGAEDLTPVDGSAGESTGGGETKGEEEEEEEEEEEWDQGEELKQLGAVLVFVPGVAELVELELKLHQLGVIAEHGFLVIKLHGQLEDTKQEEIFGPAPKGAFMVIVRMCSPACGMDVWANSVGKGGAVGGAVGLRVGLSQSSAREPIHPLGPLIIHCGVGYTKKDQGNE
jgi:hypothetical protein